MSQTLKSTELILNDSGSVYHLDLLPSELADTIIFVGDPDRVPLVSKHFDKVDIIRRKREFVTHTGSIGSMPISVISTGIGASNIDIVLNEIDALVNADFKTREWRPNLKSVRIIRLGTCGGLQEDIPVDSLIMSSYGFAFDGFLKFYQQQYSKEEKELLALVKQQFSQLPVIDNAYVGRGSEQLAALFDQHCHQGITMTCSGFYGPQYRHLRLPLNNGDIFNMAMQLKFRDQVVTNLEMETAAIYGLGGLLGYDCCSISTVVGNRITQDLTKNSAKAVDNMIQTVLGVLSS